MDSGQFELLSAAMRGDTAVVKEQIKRGVPTDTVKWDGRTALIWASENGHTQTVKCLIAAKASLDIQDEVGPLRTHANPCKIDGPSKAHTNAQAWTVTKDGNTALHIAFRAYDPSNQQRIDTCVSLIEAGGDCQRQNKKGETPIDCLGTERYGGIYSIRLDSQEAEPIRKAIERREYHLLLSKENLPVKVVKVFLVGDVRAGKTTIKKSITMQSKEESHLYIPTPGIDVGIYDIRGVGRVSLWDAAGHLEYHVSHGMFLGSRNTIAVVTYNLKEKDPVKRLRYWLRFLNSGQQRASDYKLKIILVATHLDEFEDSSQAKLLAETNLNDMRAYFGEDLNIAEDVIAVNARLPQSTEMMHFRQAVKRAHDVIKGTRRVPRLCEEIMEKKSSWISAKRPILSYDDYKDKVKGIDRLATDKLIQVSSNYLQDMGEVFLAYDGIQPTHVVLDIQWLAYHVIGPTLAGNEFSDVLRVLPNKSSYTKHELEVFYSDIADFPTLSILLQNLDLMVTFDDVNFIIPCKVQDHTRMITASKNGRSIFCVDGKSMLSPSAFPVVQARVLKYIGSRFDNPCMTMESIQVGQQFVGLAKESKKGQDAINFTVVYEKKDPESCFNDLEKITSIIVTTLYELSPGTSVATGYLSPLSIQQCHDLQSVYHYTMEEIEEGEDRYCTVYNQSMKISEKTTDILVAGGDPHFIRQKGMETDITWMIQNHKRQLYELMDATSCLRTDYRSLAEFLGIEGSILSDIEEHKSSDSCTAAVIKYWNERTRKKMTLGLLYSLLTHPGIVANVEAANVIDTMMKELRIDVSLSSKDYRSVGTGLPNVLLLWRAIIRRTHEVLRKHMDPQAVARLILCEDDANGIAEIEHNEGRVQAVDCFIFKVLGLKDLDWTDTFLNSLKQHQPDIYLDVMKARKDLNEQYVFLQSKYYVRDTITSSYGGILELHESGVRLDIPPDAIAMKEDISVYIVSPKDDQPPLRDNIIAPMIRLEPDGIKFLRPFTLTVTHSASDLKLRNLQVWNKSGNMDWQVIFDGKDGSNDSNILLKGNKVKIRSKGFGVLCLYGCDLLDVQIDSLRDLDEMANLGIDLHEGHNVHTSKVETGASCTHQTKQISHIVASSSLAQDSPHKHAEGFPDMLLLWRATVVQAHDILRRHINPTAIARLVLTEDDTNMIAQIEQSEGRPQAADKLISQLLELKDLRWTNTLPRALKNRHPDVFDAMTKTRQHLLKGESFSSCRYTVSDTIGSDGGVLELEEFSVRLEIPPGALQEKKTISVSVVSSKVDHPPLGDNFIIAPIVQLEPDGLQFLRPVTLTVKHSGINLKLRKLQVWNKTGNTDWKVVFDGNDGSPDPNMLLRGNTLKIRRQEFCLFCYIGWCTLDVQIMPFVQKDLTSTKTVGLRVFALADHDALMVEKDILDSEKEILAFGKPMVRYLLSTCTLLQIRVLCVNDKDDEDVWDLVNNKGKTEDVSAAKEITQTKLQHGDAHSCCEFFFKKCLGHDEVNSITCVLEISQHDNVSIELRAVYIMKGNDGRKCRSGQLSDKDIRLITHKADLLKSDLDNVFGELGISVADQDLGRRNAGTTDFMLQGFQILHIWHQRKGKAATRNTLVEALQKCKLNAAKEIVEYEWDHPTL